MRRSDVTRAERVKKISSQNNSDWLANFWIIHALHEIEILPHSLLPLKDMGISMPTGDSHYLAHPIISQWAYKCEIFHNM